MVELAPAVSYMRADDSYEHMRALAHVPTAAYEKGATKLIITRR